MKLLRVYGVLAMALAGSSAPSVEAAADTEFTGRSLALGGAVVVKPKYEGSDEHEVYGIPMIIPKLSDPNDPNPSAFKKFRKRIKFRGLDDIRVRALDNGALEVGLVTGYLSSRDQDDGDRLGGLGDVDGGLTLGAYAALNFGDVTFDVAAFDKVTGDDAGVQVRLGAEVERQVSARTKLTARVGTTYADEDYMQTYFGVTAASTFGLPVFNADSGFKDVHVALGAEVDLGERWVLRAGGRYGHLIGDAGDSPVIETEDQLSGTLGLAYRFGLDR